MIILYGLLLYCGELYRPTMHELVFGEAMGGALLGTALVALGFATALAARRGKRALRFVHGFRYLVAATAGLWIWAVGGLVLTQ